MIAEKMLVRRITRWACCLLGIGLIFWMAPSLLNAQPRRPQNEAPSVTIPEDQRPWPGTPWLVGTVLAVGAIAVAIKPAKRTHLD